MFGQLERGSVSVPARHFWFLFSRAHGLSVAMRQAVYWKGHLLGVSLGEHVTSVLPEGHWEAM